MKTNVDVNIMAKDESVFSINVFECVRESESSVKNTGTFSSQALIYYVLLVSFL